MPSRRHILKGLAATALLPPAVPALSREADRAESASTSNGSEEAIEWRNWSGLQRARPRERIAPDSIDKLQEIIADSQGTIRPVGAAHSFSPLMNTDDVLVSLDRLTGIDDDDPENLRATIQAGTRLSVLGQALDDIGQALPNMPDIDHQSLAGSLATATHGTGLGLGCMSDYIHSLELVTANGDTMTCSRESHPEVFHSAQVGLGALGIVTRITLNNESPYRLKKRLEWWPIEDILDQADELAREHRNFEFFYIPFSGMGFVDIQDKTDDELLEQNGTDQNEGVYDLKRARDWLSWSPRLRRWALGGYMRTLPDEQSIAPSWQTYTHSRAVRFNEMEYHLPKERGLVAFRYLREIVERDFPDVFFPFEVRYVKGDDIWLSPFFEQDSISIAVHRYYAEDHRGLFAAVEPILRHFGGRPHWGKLHSLTHDELARLYPHWDDFLSVREELDPNGRFLNDHLRQIFGLEA